jgi:hypothetical protein
MAHDRRMERVTRAGSLIAAVWLAFAAGSCTRQALRPDPEALASASPDLLAKLRADPYNYFRFVNHEWTSRACAAFTSQLKDQPAVQLHGDAHLEQYALTQTAWGLDDFDDSTRGPALVDVVRFLGSIDLAVRRRGWTRQRERLFDSFFEGYRRGLADPRHSPSRPPIVGRLQARAPAPDNERFLTSVEALMTPMSETAARGVVAAVAVFTRIIQLDRPELPDEYFRVLRAGWLHTGIGSAALNKVLIRIDGPSTRTDDDVVLEAKALRARAALGCLEVPKARPTFRVITGSLQLGRLKHDILVAGPEIPIPEVTIQGQDLSDWWVRSWEPSYREVTLDDFGSIDELAAVVYDSGAQLAAGSLHLPGEDIDAALQRQSFASIAALEASLRTQAVILVEELLRGWRQLPRSAATARQARELANREPRTRMMTGYVGSNSFRDE